MLNTLNAVILRAKYAQWSLYVLNTFNIVTLIVKYRQHCHSTR